MGRDLHCVKCEKSLARDLPVMLFERESDEVFSEYMLPDACLQARRVLSN